MLIEAGKVKPQTANKDAASVVVKSKSGKSYPNRDTAGFSDTANASFSMPTDVGITEGIVNFDDDVAVRQLCRDMYYHDPICGGAVDIYSSIPFGEFSLSGLPDKEMLYKFLHSVEKMRVKTLLPLMAVDYFVDGAASGALNFDDKQKIFDAYIPLNLDDVTLGHVPMHGHTPIMDVKFPDAYRRVFSKKNDKRIDTLIEELPNIIRDAVVKGGVLELNPENSVYIPRTSESHRKRGMSLFHRIIPYWVLEKALLRGTIMMAYRRQRGILVMQMGSDVWTATKTDMENHIREIILADRDPHGAVIAVRPDISFQEIRDGGNFWKHSDVADVYNALKMKALGISDAAFSGDTPVGAAESILSIFNQQLRVNREHIVREFLYNKAFPTISKENDYKKEDRFIETSSYEDGDYDPNFMRRRVARQGTDKMWSATAADDSDAQYYIPALNFHNSLRPEASAEYMTLLETLQKMGVPIPLRTLVSAAGMSVGDILSGQDEDVDLRKAFSAYTKAIKKYLPKLEEEGGGGDYASYREISHDTLTPVSGRRKSLAARREDYGDMQEREAVRANGGRLVSPRYVKERGEAHNRVLAEASVEMAKRNNHQVRTQERTGKQFYYDGAKS